MIEYKPKGTCSTKITFTIDDNKIHGVCFKHGCEGNLSGISKLVEGMDAEELVKTLKGIQCGRRGTSCPDQLAIAVAAQLEHA
ncbi:TSCPD domain-containing protein [Spirochaetia bacterium]|nr:TSCPD domain-containing protein [Spirochaetia bacterium]